MFLSLEKQPQLLDPIEQLHQIRWRLHIIGEQLYVRENDLMSQEYNVSGNDAVNLSKVLMLWMIQSPVDEVC